MNDLTHEENKNPNHTPSRNPENAAGRLGRWFAAQCNGDWEHMNGVTIETTDNPGWFVKIDLDGTTAQNLTGKGKRGELTWEVSDGVLNGYDEETGNLEGLLTLLLDLVESQNNKGAKQPVVGGQEIAWLRGRVKELQGRVAVLERDSHAPVDLRPAVSAIVAELVEATQKH